MGKDFAVILTGGKQYKVSAGDTLKIEKLKATEDGAVSFAQVLLRTIGNEVQIGAPYVPQAVVTGKVMRDGREKKKIIFRYHSKTRLRKKKGHRQHFTEVAIVSI